MNVLFGWMLRALIRGKSPAQVERGFWVVVGGLAGLFTVAWLLDVFSHR